MFKFFVVFFALIIYPHTLLAQGPSINREDYNRMQNTYHDCISSAYNTQYKCDCAAVKFMDEIRTERLNLNQMGFSKAQIDNTLHIRADKIRSTAYRSCINRDGVALNSYGRCIDWAIKTRDDYREFCGCYALRYADTFEQEGMNFFADPSSVMAQAMITCNRQLQKP